MHASLARVPLFRTVPAKDLQVISDASKLLRFQRGELVFKEHERATSIWIVRRGWVYLTKQTPGGGVATIFAMTPDEVICGVSAFEYGTYSASAVSATDSQLIEIPADAFSNLLERHPKFTRQVLLTCCTRMRHMAEAISLSQAPVAQRMSHALLRLRATFGSTVPITHHELARMAGTRWETSIRTLSAMKRKGWIRTSRGQVTILKPKQLQASRGS